MRPLILLLFILVVSITAHASDDLYPLHYTVTLLPEQDQAEVVIESDHGGRLETLDFNISSGRYSDFEGNGELEIERGRAVWTPPEEDARLSFHVKISHERDPGEYDARMTPDWALFRGDDIIPAARVSARGDARAEAYLTFRLPETWTDVVTGWEKLDDRRFRIDNPERRFDRPTGWMIAGKLSTREEQLGDTTLVVSKPAGDPMRLMDVVSLITNVWPEFEQAFGQTPPKFAVVGADDPMWRGALSGPNALFLHSDRPMVSGNGTSTVVHELVHVVTRIDSHDQSDWLVEGLAEFYAVELMYRAGAFTDARRQWIMDWLKDWSSEIDSLRTEHSASKVTARAVLLFDELDREIREVTGGQRSLDDVTRQMIQARDVSTDELKDMVADVMGRPSKTLKSPLLNPR